MPGGKKYVIGLKNFFAYSETTQVRLGFSDRRGLQLMNFFSQQAVQKSTCFKFSFLVFLSLILGFLVSLESFCKVIKQASWLCPKPIFSRLFFIWFAASVGTYLNHASAVYFTALGWVTENAYTGAPNDGFLLNTLKTRFRLSRVLLDL